ncbi:hypothetical protein QFC21_005528 [Naganishia friedmannii]|uniref:Uncharacterized protein n=1 Tax=Naganishia friedmannii TaxID=89922 RepID=A0ACC2V9X7_9TREE|nr:hypothetical protein QFC21_005528 [Naganishia friedmannii]
MSPSISDTNAADGVCEHLQSCSTDAIKDLQGRYRKIMNWCIKEEMDPSTIQTTQKGTPRRLPKCHLCKRTSAASHISVCLGCETVSCRKTISIKRLRTDGNEDSARAPSSSSRAPAGAAAGVGGGKGKMRKVVVDHPGDHAAASGHSFSVDGSTGAIFCHGCDDFVYAEAVDQWRNRALRMMEERADISVDGSGSKRAKFKVWKATPEDRAAMERNEAVRCHFLNPPPLYRIAIRPLLNLSQTCFLSAILQAFFHNPLLKQYFLNEGHSRRACEAERGVVGKDVKVQGKDDVVAAGVGGVGECMGCEMDSAFIEAYNGEGTPFGPTALLLSMWKASAELAGHEQQDRSFAGTLLSTVTCANCSAQTNTEDPILDISLGLDVKNGKGAGGVLTLGQCFRRYTAKETLSGKAYTCSKCKVSSNGIRFEQNSTNLSKVETMVNFPTELDMRPYMHDAVNGQSNSLPREMYRYTLSTVVTHEGKLDNGHYWADVKSGLTSTTLAQVLNQKAYMLFYVKNSVAFQSDGHNAT